jgi:4-amino-4-deoxy-L-arabinose transferase-like glycosyltransferase
MASTEGAAGPLPRHRREWMRVLISPSCIPLVLFVCTFLIYLAGFYILGHWAALAGQRIPVAEYSPEYMNLAHNLSLGIFSQSPHPPFVPDTFRTPGYPVFLNVLFRLGDVQWVALVQILLASATVVLTYLLAKRISGRIEVGVLAAVLLMMSITNFVYAMTLDAETLLTFILVSAVYLYMYIEDREPKVLSYALLGLLLGIGILVKPVLVFVPALLGLCTLITRNPSRRVLPVVVMGLTVLLVTVPWLARNAQIADVWGISTVSSYNFYQFYIPSFIAYRDAVPLDTARAAFESLHPHIPHDTQDIRYAPAMRAAVAEAILEDPGAYLGFHLSFLEMFFKTSGYLDLPAVFTWVRTSVPVPSSDNALEIAVLEEFWGKLFLYIALFSAFFIRPLRWYFVLGILILYFAVAAGPVSLYAAARLRMPINPLWAILTATALYGGARLLGIWMRSRLPENRLGTLKKG